MNLKPSIKTYNDAVDLTLELNQKIKVLQKCVDEDDKETDEVIFQGRVLSTNSDHFTLIKRNGNRESFKYSELIENRLRIVQG